MKMITTLATGAAMAFAAIPFASPAMAQGAEAKFPVPRAGCPKTHFKSRRGSDTIFYCYPKEGSDDSKSSNSSSSSGSTYEGPAADRLVSYGTITKANRLDRCPLGYFSKSDMTTCTTRLSPAPKSRNKTGACNSNEIDEWGLYCTADANVITREQAEQEADRDFNAIYSANGAQGPTQTPSGDDTTNSAPMVAAYGPKGGAQASNASASSGDQPAAQQTAQCPAGSGSATGAAIGGAVGGDAGAVLGGMLGGLGKKKKKKGC